MCGAILADYLLSGRKWARPRQGINSAGYGAWAAGFLVGIVPLLAIFAAVVLNKLATELVRACGELATKGVSVGQTAGGVENELRNVYQPFTEVDGVSCSNHGANTRSSG